MDRRAFIRSVVSGLIAAPLAARAQQAGKVHRIGFLGNSTPAHEANLVGPFREGLRELGYVEGRNILIEYRWAEGKYERFPALIRELIALKVDVIVTAGTPASLAVKKATTSIPLVMVGWLQDRRDRWATSFCPRQPCRMRRRTVSRFQSFQTARWI
jgi:putative ABC transport system substrate-binding protein